MEEAPLCKQCRCISGKGKDLCEGCADPPKNKKEYLYTIVFRGSSYAVGHNTEDVSSRVKRVLEETYPGITRFFVDITVEAWSNIYGVGSLPTALDNRIILGSTKTIGELRKEEEAERKADVIARAKKKLTLEERQALGLED